MKTKFANLILKEQTIEERKMEKYLTKKQELQQEIQAYEEEIKKVKTQIKETPRKISFDQLPDSQKFDNVINKRKHLLDTIKIIAYRAETALANTIKQHLNTHHKDEARMLLKQIYKTDADIVVDEKAQTLTVIIHPLSHFKDDKILEKLCKQLNQTETVFPDTNLTLIYKLGSS